MRADEDVAFRSINNVRRSVSYCTTSIRAIRNGILLHMAGGTWGTIASGLFAEPIHRTYPYDQE